MGKNERKRWALALVLSWGAIVAGCSFAGSRERYIRTPTSQPSETAGITVERSVHGVTGADWIGPTATESQARLKPFEVDGDTLKSGGGTWSVLDSIGSWFTKSTAFLTLGALGVGLFSVLGSFLTGTGGLSGIVRGISQTISGMIPGVGAIIQRVLHGKTAGMLTQVVKGGDAFKAGLGALSGLKAADKDKLWSLFKQSQQSVQDSETQHKVNSIRNGG